MRPSVFLVLVAAMGCRATPPAGGKDTAGVDDPDGLETAETDTATDSAPPDTDETGDSGPAADSATDSGNDTDSTPPDATVDWDAKLVGAFGWMGDISVAQQGELTGDGIDDLVIGLVIGPDVDVDSGGSVFVVSGGGELSGTQSMDEMASSAVGDITDTVGFADEVAVGDVDGDGQSDLVVSDAAFYEWDTFAYAGAVFVFAGPITGTEGDESVVATLTTMCPAYPESYSYCRIGDHLDVGDANGDAYADIALTGGIAEGAYTAAIVAGPVAGDVDLAFDALAWFDRTYAVWFVGDTDGDGQEDVLSCGYTQTDILLGPLAGVYTDGDGENGFVDSYCSAPRPVADDLDGDGYVDFVIANAGADDGSGGRGGHVYVAYGPIVGHVVVGDLSVRLSGTGDQTFGASLASLGDLDGNGHVDLVVGAPDEGDFLVDGPGAAYIFYGPLGGVSGPEDADQVLAENDGDDTFSHRLANVGDLDNDGLDDLAITGPGDDEGGGYSGAVWLYYGASLVP